MRTPKILSLDIETSFVLAYTFSLYPDSIPHTNIVEDWHIHCACWKWYGKDKVYTAIEDRDRDDAKIVSTIMDEIAKADLVVAHNGKKFDLKKLQARATAHGLGQIAPTPCVDTLLEARASNAFTSNRLDYLGEYLGVGRKLQNSASLWHKAFIGDRKALKQMAEYCAQDVLVLERVYDELKPFMKNHPNMSVIMETEDGCPACGSTNIQQRGWQYTKIGKKKRFMCNDCGRWSVHKTSDVIASIR